GKGLDLLLDAVGLLRARGLDVTLDVVGDMDGWEGPEYRGYRASLRARADAADLAGAVQFLGWREDVPAALAAGSIHCCPTHVAVREAFGNVVLEAKRSGMPSVVTPSGNLKDLVRHRGNGWVCADSTADAIAEGLAFFATSEDARAAAGRGALASLADYSEEQFVRGWSGVFALDSDDDPRRAVARADAGPEMASRMKGA